MKVVLAVASALCVAVGVALVSLPLGLVTAGSLGLSGAYSWAYLDARRGAKR